MKQAGVVEYLHWYGAGRLISSNSGHMLCTKFLLFKSLINRSGQGLASITSDSPAPEFRAHGSLILRELRGLYLLPLIMLSTALGVVLLCLQAVAEVQDAVASKVIVAK